jgi:hypothetical protein
LTNPKDWVDVVNEVQMEGELEAVHRSVKRGCPLGDEEWQRAAEDGGATRPGVHVATARAAAKERLTVPGIEEQNTNNEIGLIPFPFLLSSYPQRGQTPLGIVAKCDFCLSRFETISDPFSLSRR